MACRPKKSLSELHNRKTMQIVTKTMAKFISPCLLEDRTLVRARLIPLKIIIGMYDVKKTVYKREFDLQRVLAWFGFFFNFIFCTILFLRHVGHKIAWIIRVKYLNRKEKAQ